MSCPAAGMCLPTKAILMRMFEEVRLQRLASQAGPLFYFLATCSPHCSVCTNLNVRNRAEALFGPISDTSVSI